MEKECATNPVEGMTAKEMLGYYQKKALQDAIEGKKKGELVCWSSSIAPNEFCEAMGVHMMYPENHAAGVGARHGAMDLISVAEAEGYNGDNCAYARINLGYVKAQTCVGDQIPLPDFVMYCNNICETLVKWYENLANELNIPCIVVDTPYNYEYEPNERSVKYIERQFQDVIRQLEVICGRPFDYERFEEVMKISVDSCNYWMKAMGMLSVKPAPMNGFDVFNYMALIVLMRGKTGCRDTFKKLYEELQEKADKGIAAMKDGEKHRFMWDGIAVWPYLGPTLKTFKSMGMNLTGSTYPSAWNMSYKPGDLTAMARTYTTVMNNMNMARQIDINVDCVTENACDCVTYHLNRSCKCMCMLNAEKMEAVKEKTGTPYVSFDGDQCDPRNFSEAQFATRIQSLYEMLEEDQ